MTFYPPSPEQLGFVEILRKRHHIPPKLLDNHCVQRFNDELAKLSGRQVSQLIDEMKAWEMPPAEMQRALGQLDLFGATS